MPSPARAAALFLTSALLLAQPSSSDFVGALEWRFIGPFRGGRVLAVTGVPGDQRTFYFGSVGGGVWKTTDAGTVWTPVFDSQSIASIGAIAVAPSNPNVIYAGTGEADMRSDISVGNGIYKSSDAGRTWANVGLRDSQQIGRMLVDPRNADLVYVAALGHAYAPNAERGVYRSNNGGRTWTKVLDKGADIGAVDLAFEPENPRVIYATVWNSRRPPWSQYGPLEGPGSGLYKSTDGGDHWSQLTGNGLPQGDWGRVGVAVARGTGGRRVYALIDAKNAGGLYRSDDSGRTWVHIGTDSRIFSRGWYFGEVDVDPHNPDIVYVPNVAVYRSIDGGKTFGVLKGAPGGDDYHALWIDPSESARMILGSDQGTNISVDGGRTWTLWYNQPTAQMYHVATDNQFPYHVYGSQQDSGTVALPSRTSHGQINEYDRANVGGAESGYVAPDPKDPNIVYVGNTNGSLARFDKRTAQSQNITPWPEPAFGTEISQRKYRAPWTAPLIFSPIEPHALYFGSQVLLKTIDGGLNWSEISPDLTGAETKGKQAAPPEGPVTAANAKARGYGVIYSIAPSPLNAALIWVGSDTGLIHVTRSGGKQWSNVTPQGLADWSKIAQIDASHFDAAVAYAAVDRHRLDDYAPHIFRTRDYGKTWTEVNNGIAAPAFVNAVREDPARKGLLYAATEMGVYVSFDDGDHWQSLQLNLPVTSVRDLVVHGDDLVIATHGRGFWILDDVEPIRENRAGDQLHLCKPVTAIRMSSDGFQGTPFPPEEPRAQNPPNGAVIDYYLPSIAEDEVTLEILDAKNQVVRRYSTKDQPRVQRTGLAIADIWVVPPPQLTAKAGLNRFVWDLRYAPPQAIAEGRRGGGGGSAVVGPFVLPGAYQVRVTAQGHSSTQPLKVTLDPHSGAPPADLSAQFDLGMKAYRGMQRAADLARQTTDARTRTAITAAHRKFGVVLGVVNSADRRPPAQAHAIYEEALRDLDASATDLKKATTRSDSGR
jgi:photosystem II stability/assembly factor-like uncharacterized protein